MSGATETLGRVSAPQARTLRSPVDLLGYVLPGSDSAVRRRRALAIRGYMGANGHFKTAMAVRDLVPDILADRAILSTTPINDPRTGKLYDGFTLFENWDQMFDIRDGALLLDEITGVLDSRADAMPERIRLLLPQMRKRGVSVSYTAPDMDNADKRLRQISWGISVCRGYLPARRRRTENGALDAWRPNRLASVMTFDTLGSAQLSENTRRTARIKIREWVYMPCTGAFDLYDTLYQVQQVSDNCPKCGLPFRREFHSASADARAEALLGDAGAGMTEIERRRAIGQLDHDAATLH